MVTEVPLLAEATTTGFANARLETRVNPLVPMDAEDPVECLVAVATLELSRSDLDDLTYSGHFGHLGNERMVVDQRVRGGR